MRRSFLIIKNVLFISIITSFFIYMIIFLEKDVAEYNNVIILNDEDTREISVGGKKRTQEVFDYILHNLNFKEERISDKYVKVIGRP